MSNWQARVLPAPLLRREFRVDSPVAEAVVHVCGLGYCELHLNGGKVGDRVLDPVVTQYDRRVRYTTYDVTSELHQGANAIAAVLGNGWYNCHTTDVWHFDKASWRDYPKLLLQLEITYADGEREVLVSGSDWRVGESPIRFDGLRNGETYDARREMAGWDRPGFDDSAWARAGVVAGPGGELEPQTAPPCRVVETLTPVDVRVLGPGHAVFDLGQNMAGWARLHARGPAGTEVTLRYAEKLAPDGTVDQGNINSFIKSGDCQTDRYTLKGTEGEEVWEPRFTYHGFQYVEVTGYPGTPTVESLEGRVVQTDFDRVGTLSTSDPELNRLQDCTLWAYRGNFVGIPTDCPHREKNGWTGDAQLAAETGLMNFAAAPAYREWLATLVDT
jgi:alpha-L-rhamnosidase